jgi:serine/threonine-protein kinase
MGEVFAATHARLPGLFAIKVLQPEFADDLEICTRFRREAEVMATLHHPHIVQVADYDTSPEGRPYLVMEHLDGPDLGMVMRRQGPLPCALVASLVAQMAAALAAAHARGIVHLDLKPENVVVLGLDEGTPFVKIIDFGIAKSATSEKEPEGTIIGTPEYMSPEQIEGHLDRIDGRSDQFSLATMAFVMLTGHSPWGMEEPFALLHRIGHERAQSLANYLSLPMPHVEAVLQRALAKAPEARYATITAFAEALEDAINRDGAGRSRFSRFGEEDTFRSFG